MTLDDANDDTADANLEARYYPLQNWRADVVCVGKLNDEAFELVEVVDYDTYGNALSRPAVSADFDHDGGVTGSDLSDFFTAHGNGDPEADADLSGGITNDDIGVFYAAWEAGISGPSRGACAYSGVIAGYAGYVRDRFASNGDLYHVRHRVYDTRMGTWTKRDPLGYVDGMGLYEYTSAAPIVLVDPTGEIAVPVDENIAKAIAIALIAIAAWPIAVQQAKLCEMGFPPIAIDWSLGLDSGTTVCRMTYKIAEGGAAAGGAAAAGVAVVMTWSERLVVDECSVYDGPSLRVFRNRDCEALLAADTAVCGARFEYKVRQCMFVKPNWGHRKRCIAKATWWLTNCEAVAAFRYAQCQTGMRLAPRLRKGWPFDFWPRARDYWWWL